MSKWFTTLRTVGNVALTDHMRRWIYNVPPSGYVLDAVLVACVRIGHAQRAVELPGMYKDVTLEETGLKHLLKAHAELRDPVSWDTSRSLMKRHRDVLEMPSMRQTDYELIIAFARGQSRDVCDDIMSLAGIEVSDVEYILN